MKTPWKNCDIPEYQSFQKPAPEKKLPGNLSPAFTAYMIKLKLVAAVHTIEYSPATLKHTAISIFSKASS